MADYLQTHLWGQLNHQCSAGVFVPSFGQQTDKCSAVSSLSYYDVQKVCFSCQPLLAISLLHSCGPWLQQLSLWASYMCLSTCFHFLPFTVWEGRGWVVGSFPPADSVKPISLVHHVVLHGRKLLPGGALLVTKIRRQWRRYLANKCVLFVSVCVCWWFRFCDTCDFDEFISYFLLAMDLGTKTNLLCFWG